MMNIRGRVSVLPQYRASSSATVDESGPMESWVKVQRFILPCHLNERASVTEKMPMVLAVSRQCQANNARLAVKQQSLVATHGPTVYIV